MLLVTRHNHIVRPYSQRHHSLWTQDTETSTSHWPGNFPYPALPGSYSHPALPGSYSHSALPGSYSQKLLHALLVDRDIVGFIQHWTLRATTLSDLLARFAHWCNDGMKILGVTNCSTGKDFISGTVNLVKAHDWGDHRFGEGRWVGIYCRFC